MKALRVVNWQRYEKTDAKKCKVMQWVGIPITHDGLGYIEIMAHPDGIRIIGGWLLIVQTAARCPKRGLLVSDSGRILRAREIALKTRAQEADITLCIETLLANGWLEEVEVSGQHPEDIRTASGLQDRTGQDRTGEDSAPEASGSQSPPPAGKPGERTKATLRGLGLRATDETAQEWADLARQRAKCRNAESILEFIRWSVKRAKSDGNVIQYAREASLYADEWSHYRGATA